MDVSSGGFADPTIIYAGGSETVGAGGTDLGARILRRYPVRLRLCQRRHHLHGFAGHREPAALRAARWSPPTVSETVLAGATDFGAQISGGYQDVFGVAIGATISGGTLTLGRGRRHGEQHHGNANSSGNNGEQHVLWPGGFGRPDEQRQGIESMSGGTASATTVDSGSSRCGLGQRAGHQHGRQQRRHRGGVLRRYGQLPRSSPAAASRSSAASPSASSSSTGGIQQIGGNVTQLIRVLL